MIESTTEFPDVETGDDVSSFLDDLGIDVAEETEKIHEECDNATFDDVDTVRPTTEKFLQRQQNAIKQIVDWCENVRSGEPLYLDFETIPDFERLPLFDLPPLPEMPPVDALDSILGPDELVSQTVPEIEAWLSKHNPPAEWIAQVELAEKSLKKPRKGSFDAIEAHRKRMDSIASAESERIKLLSTKPLYCSICCVSLAVGREEPISLFAANKEEEGRLIEYVWQIAQKYSPLVGFNISGFDIPVLITRSMILNIKPGRLIDRRRYGSRDVLDLCQELLGDSWDGRKGFGLKPVCLSLGIQPKVDSDGSKVYGFWKAGKYDEICDYCCSDSDLTQRLHGRMSGFFVV
jgi:hypothetical protein